YTHICACQCFWKACNAINERSSVDALGEALRKRIGRFCHASGLRPFFCQVSQGCCVLPVDTWIFDYLWLKPHYR
ncbi:MAG: hypothetical protein ACU83U_06440, partial [Gammaproteobacteria bacterium]